MAENSAGDHGSELSDDDSIRLLFDSAQRGSKEAMGELLEGCRQYLLLIAERELGGQLRSKAGASDLVQETFLEAQAAFERFSGETEGDLLAWLRGILLHNLSDFVRRYHGAGKRRTSQERRLDSAFKDLDADTPLGEPGTTPSGRLMRQEQVDALRAAVSRLPDDYRRVVFLRYREGLTFAEIGRRTGRSPDAARMLWTRALKRLSGEMETDHG